MAGVPNFCSKTNGPPPPLSEEKCGSHGGGERTSWERNLLRIPSAHFPFLWAPSLFPSFHPVFKSFGSAAAAAGDPKYTFESLPTAKSDMPPDKSVFEASNPLTGLLQLVHNFVSSVLHCFKRPRMRISNDIFWLLLHFSSLSGRVMLSDMCFAYGEFTTRRRGQVWIVEHGHEFERSARIGDPA